MYWILNQLSTLGGRLEMGNAPQFAHMPNGNSISLLSGLRCLLSNTPSRGQFLAIT
jgi:hypothetical protein